MPTDRPLVSVITPTIPERVDLAVEAMRNVRAQGYPNLEHVVVVDAPDDNATIRLRLETVAMTRHVPTRVQALGRNWSTFLADSYAAAPVLVGQMLARGEYQMIWADDERALETDHVAALVDLLEATGADFVYPKVRMWWHGRPGHTWEIGTDPPQHGTITHWLYRASLLDLMRGPYRTHVGRANDWEFVERAIKHGARWAFLDRVTFSHRADA